MQRCRPQLQFALPHCRLKSTGTGRVDSACVPKFDRDMVVRRSSWQIHNTKTNLLHLLASPLDRWLLLLDDSRSWIRFCLLPCWSSKNYLEIFEFLNWTCKFENATTRGVMMPDRQKFDLLQLLRRGGCAHNCIPWCSLNYAYLLNPPAVEAPEHIYRQQFNWWITLF